MAFGFPIVEQSQESSDPLQNILGTDFPLFRWNDLTDKEDPIGRGSFGSVFVANRQGSSEKIVVKKILSKDHYEQCLFLKEAKILRRINNEHVVRFKAACVNPCAIMLEYVCFDFTPFGVSEIVHSLEDFLLFIERKGIVHKFPFQHKIVEDVSRGVAHLHKQGIVHRDIKPANVLLSNQHYSTLTDKEVLQQLFETQPIVCKLADFGESRSAVNQTAQLCRLATANIARGTPVYRAPELFGNNSKSTMLSVQDLKAADVWALGMVFFVVINPDLKFPYEIELQDVQPGGCFSELERRILNNEKPNHSPKYKAYRVAEWNEIVELFEKCTAFAPKDRPHTKDIVDFLIKTSGSSCLNIPLRVSQNSAVENATDFDEFTDGTNSCALLSLAFCNLLFKKDDEIPVGEEGFRKIASLAEEVIENYPAKFNCYRQVGVKYDISEAYKILRSSHIVDEAFQFNEHVISSSGVFSSGGRCDFTEAVNQIYDAEKTKVGLYTCGGYIFTIGCKNGQYFVTDTHSIGKELGGNGNGLLKVFLSSDGDVESSVRCICDWVLRRL